MSIRERMLAVYRGEAPNRPPVGIYNRYLPRGEGERLVRGMGCGIIDYLPAVSMLAPPWHFGDGYLSEVKNCDCRIDYKWERGNLIYRRAFRTPVGELWQEMEPDPSGAGSEHIRKQYIASPEDYAVARYIVENTVFHRNDEALRRRRDALGEDGVVLGRLDRVPYQKMLIELMGAEKLFLELYTDPDPVLELMEAIGRRLDESFELALESPAEVFWQPDNITADMTPPDSFERFCRPYYRKRAALLRQAGKPYVVHMDGRLGPYRGMLGHGEMDVLESFSLPLIGGDLTYAQAREAFDGVTILPNFPANLCVRGDEEIRQEMSKLLEEAQDASLMLQVSEDIPDGQWRRVLPILCRLTESV